jgi:beta-glucosidase
MQNETNSFWGKALVELVQNGTLPEWRVDDMVTRTMAAFFQMGQDQGYPAVKYVSVHLLKYLICTYD